ncbi:unnamed protein product [Lactuca virosa]|uniref:Uncharacterized protein n=1 Tax=Lactuca virosa TaxID=75947 RepID=A0AAU9PC76_9ASTR|nr:unnamed protein product [Lactuca virosa]
MWSNGLPTRLTSDFAPCPKRWTNLVPMRVIRASLMTPPDPSLAPAVAFTESMADDGSWREASSSEEERAVLDDLDPVDTPETEDGDDTEPDYTPAEHPLEPTLSPDCTLAGIKLLHSKYEHEEDEEETSTPRETSPPRPTPSH